MRVILFLNGVALNGTVLSGRPESSGNASDPLAHYLRSTAEGEVGERFRTVDGQAVYEVVRRWRGTTLLMLQAEHVIESASPMTVVSG